MKFIDIKDLLRDILSRVAGCSDYTIIDQIRLAAIDFSSRTLVSQDSVCGLDITANERFVPVPCPSTQVEMIYVTEVSLNTQGALVEVNRRFRNYFSGRPRNNYRWDNYGEPAPWPRNWSLVRKSGIMLSPIPKEDRLEEVNVTAAYQPVRNATKLDRLMVDEHRQALIDRTLYQLLNMAGEDWGNPIQARVHDKDYEIHVSTTKVLVQRDFGLAETFVQHSPLA